MHKAAISTKIITRLQSFGIQLMPPSWGVSADIVCSSPTNVGHKQYFDTRVVLTYIGG